MSTPYFLNITPNINFNVTIIAQNSDGTFINLTGYNTSGYIRNSYGDSGVLYNFFVTADPSYISGIVYLSGKYPVLNPSGYQNPLGTFPFDVIAVNSQGYETMILGGFTNIGPIVTY